MTGLLSDAPISWIRAACKLRLVSYGSKHTSQSLSNITFCVYLTKITRKLQVMHGCSTYQTTALLLEMSIFWVRVACEIKLVSYGSKHASQSLSDMPFVHTSTHTSNVITNGRIWTFCIPYQTTAL